MAETFEKLSSGETDMVLGPAKDGGYYLVGLRKETSNKLGTPIRLITS